MIEDTIDRREPIPTKMEETKAFLRLKRNTIKNQVIFLDPALTHDSSQLKSRLSINRPSNATFKEVHDQ